VVSNGICQPEQRVLAPPRPRERVLPRPCADVRRFPFADGVPDVEYQSVERVIVLGATPWWRI
jgi:hypothetical protein